MVLIPFQFDGTSAFASCHFWLRLVILQFNFCPQNGLRKRLG